MKNECRSFLGKIREQLTEVTEEDSLEEQTMKKELEVLKIQLGNLEKDHQKQVEALQTKIEEGDRSS